MLKKNKNRAKAPNTVLRSLLVAVGLLLFVGLLGAGYFYLDRLESPPDTRGMPVDVHFLQTENDADCALIKQGDISILIDTGEDTDAEAIMAFLEEQGVNSISLLILTHPDKDHIGGAPALVERFPVKRVVYPRYNKDSEAFDLLKQQLRQQGVQATVPLLSRTLTVGDISLSFFPPYETNYKKDNNYSLAVLASHGDVRMLFAADAEEKRLQELMKIHWPEIDLLKVPHHGRASVSSGAFIEIITPEYAVVTSDTADMVVKNALESAGTEMFFTRQGRVSFQSDGVGLVPAGERRKAAGWKAIFRDWVMDYSVPKNKKE